MRIAVIGSGIAGNVIAHHLHATHEITLFEKASHIGGHTHTHTIEYKGESHQIDTGFIVFNDWTYPLFTDLLRQLSVADQLSDMSFSVHNEASGLEYNGTSINRLFAQRRNLLRPGFYRMLLDINRFNKEALSLLDSGSDESLGDYLARGRYSNQFITDYLVPMGAAIWSAEPDNVLGFPVQFFVRFFHNHGMLSVNDRPKWRVIRGGSARYVEKLSAPFRPRIRLNSPVERIARLTDRVIVESSSRGTEVFDAVFIACHADQAFRLLDDPSEQERSVLGAFEYQSNEAVLHTDISVLPRKRRAWAAWNYHLPKEKTKGPGGGATVTYNMNILQGLSSGHTFCVTLNRTRQINPARIIKTLHYEHPGYSAAAVAAQKRHAEISGVRNTFYCGAYWGYGFHEDGVASAMAALRQFEGRVHA